jgi:hypothetical protein
MSIALQVGMKHPGLVLLALGLTASPIVAHAEDALSTTVTSHALASRELAMNEVVASLERPAPEVRDQSANTVETIAIALRDRVSIAHDQAGHGVPAAHCREASSGCDRRMHLFAEYLVEAGQARQIDPWLLAAIAVRETMLNPFAVGSVGELGILQINPARRDAKQVRFIRDARYRKQCRSVEGACQREIVEHAASILAQNMNACQGRTRLALGAYNSGRCTGSRTMHSACCRSGTSSDSSPANWCAAPPVSRHRPEGSGIARNESRDQRRTAYISAVQ